jgi:hypothetical protein
VVEMPDSGHEYVQSLLLAAEHRTKTHYERLGQAFFNVLVSEHPEIANAIVATEFDPYYSKEVNNSITEKVARLYDGAKD